MKLFNGKYASIVALVSALFLSAQVSAQNIQLGTPDEDLEDTLRQSVRVLNMPEDATHGDVVAAAQGDYARLVAVLYDNGYYGPSVSIKLGGKEASSLSTFRPPTNIGEIAISVNQGPKFQFGLAKIAPLPKGTELPDTFREGRTARTERVREAAQIGVEAWRAASHAKADISQTNIVARHAAHQLDVAITIDPGPPLRFGQLRSASGGLVRDERVRAIAGFPTGVPFHPDDFRRVRQRLVETGAFNSVVLREAKQPNPDGTLDAELILEDAPQRRLGFGAEISSQEGLSVEAFWLHRNFFGGAERLRLSLDIDGIGAGSANDGVDYELGATLKVPGFKRPDDTLTLAAMVQSLDEPTYTSEVLEFGVSRERQFNEKKSAAIGAGFRSARTHDAFGSREFRHAIFSAEGTYDGRDNQLAPRKGQYVNFELKPFLGLSGSESGLRVYSDFRSYFSLADNTVLAGRLQLGSVLGSTLQSTPPEFLYLSGGGGTVRGRDYQSLGVELPTGRVGGRSFMGLSAEIRQNLGSNFGIVGFADYGYVADDSNFTSGTDHAGIGIGARYATGLGSLRLDIATQAGSGAAQNVFLYIGLGEAF